MLVPSILGGILGGITPVDASIEVTGHAFELIRGPKRLSRTAGVPRAPAFILTESAAPTNARANKLYG